VSGNLYQLHCARHLSAGACVYVNGEYDQFGIIVERLEGVRDGLQLCLVRGTGYDAQNWPIHDTVSFLHYEGCSTYLKETSTYGDHYCLTCNQALPGLTNYMRKL